MKLLNKKFIFLAVLLLAQYGHALLEDDRAAYYAQKQEWAESAAILQPSLTQYPDDPKKLYGLGVASYKQEEYDKASAYFSSALEYEKSAEQKEKLFFNYGNALALQKKLPEAVDAYENAIKINPDNEQTKHNLEVVKKMLENQEQQQQQQNDQQNQQQEDQNKENEQQQDQQDQQSNQDNQNNTNDSNQNKDSDGQQDQQGNQDQQDQSGNSEHDKEQEDKGEHGDRQEESGKDEQSQDKSGKESGNEPQQQDGDTERDSERGDHDSSPQEPDNEQNSPGQDTQEEEKEQEASGGGFGDTDENFKQLDARLAQLLESQEKKDADLSKQIIQMQVGKEMAGQDGQNRW